MKSDLQRLCGNLSWHKKGDILAHITTDKFNLNQLRPWLPVGTALPSTATLNAKISGQLGHIQRADAKLDISAGSWVLIDQYTKHHIPIDAINITLTQDNNKLQIQGKIHIAQQKPMVLSLTFPHFQWPISKQQSMQGTIQWQTDQLAALPLPDITIQQGHLDLMASLHGTLGAPDFNGHLFIKDTTLAIPALGTTWQNMNLQVTAKERKAKAQLTAQSGSGTLQASSEITWSKQPWQSRTMITGQNFPIIQNSEYQLWITPKVTLHSKGWQQTLSGSIHIPKANFTPKDFSSSTELSQDATFAHETQNIQATEWPLGTLSLSLGDHATIQTHGISGQVQGQLSIKSTPGQIIHATGQINLLKGQYNAYGQALNIDHGQITYHNNPLNNPNLNIQASRLITTNTQSDDSSASSTSNNNPSSSTFTDIYNKITVGIILTGPFNNPSHTLFSKPAGLLQGDILSYLILGKSINQSQGSGDASSLLNTLSLLGLQSGGGGLVNQLKRNMGLADINLISTTGTDADDKPTQNMAIAVGKKISDKLYASYSMGLAEPSMNTFKIRYQINKRWSVQSVSSMIGNGVDLLFSF